MRRIPSWKLLTAFEAAARHRSFSRAARELNVQQPAISRRVARLEEELATKLLIRSRPHATLTDDGEILFRALTASLLQVEAAVGQIADRGAARRVVVQVTIGFASCFLLRRLGAFRDAHPEIDLELVSRDRNDTYTQAEADVLIVFERPTDAPGAHKRLIFPERMVALASPEYIASKRGDLRSLEAHTVLKLDTDDHGRDWSTFSMGSDIDMGRFGDVRRFNSFMVYLQAALNGDGVAIGWRSLLDDHLEAGQLTPVFDRIVETERGYYCRLTERGHRSDDARAFQEWVAGLCAV